MKSNSIIAEALAAHDRAVIRSTRQQACILIISLVAVCSLLIGGLMIASTFFHADKQADGVCETCGTVHWATPGCQPEKE